MESSRRVYDSLQSDALKISVSSSLSLSPSVFAGCWILNAVAKLDRNGLGWCPRQATPWERKQKHPEIMSKFTTRTKVDGVVLILTLREKLRNLAERCPREIERNVKRVKWKLSPPLREERHRVEMSPNFQIVSFYVLWYDHVGKLAISFIFNSVSAKRSFKSVSSIKFWRFWNSEICIL